MDGQSATESGVAAVVEYNYTAKEPDELDLVKGSILHNIKQLPGGWWEGTLKASGKTGMFPDNFVRVIDMSDDNNVVLRDKTAASNRRCKVIYSYTQVNDDELSLAVGDVIEFLGEVEEGWWRGRLRSKVGVFPSNFVVAIEPSPVLASKRPSQIIAPSAAAAIAATTAAAATKTAQLNSGSTVSSSTSSATTKKTNRLSFHNSKEDLLSSGSTTSTSSSSGHLHHQQHAHTSNVHTQDSHHTTITTTQAPATGQTLVDDVAPSLPPKPQRDYCRVEFPYAPQNEDELELKVGDIINVVSMELPDKGWWKGELRGKIGVFPDNFVKLITATTVSPFNDLLESSSAGQKGNVKITTTASSNATHLSTTSSSSLSTTTTILNNNNNSTASSKVQIKKSGSTSSTQSSNPKDNFGSRDSLNDILSETGLQSGNVAAQRKSLENKNLDLSNGPDAGARLVLKKQQQQQQQQQQQHLIKNSVTESKTSSMIMTSTQTTMNSSASTELRKSMENIDEKAKTAAAAAPPVLTKKPSIPTKKSTVAGNIISGLKQKVKSVESKLTTTVSHDYADGVASSKQSPGGIPEAGAPGSVVMRRAATIAVEDSEFDRVERTSILPDMRAGRVRAPKRRPPSAAINVIGESNNNEMLYMNGSGSSLGGGGGVDGGDLTASDDNKMQSSDENSTGEEQLAKPKPREWEKKKAPWMEELKASQVKKKTSPNTTESRLSSSGSGSAADRLQKSVVDDGKLNTIANNVATNSAPSNSGAVKLQSPSVGSSANPMQQSMTSSTIDTGAQPAKRYTLKGMTESATTTTSNTTTSSLTASTTSSTTTVEDVRTRPSSLSIRIRSVSPSPQNTAASSAKSSESITNSHSTSNTTSATTAVSKTSALNNHHVENNITAAVPASVKPTPSTTTLCAVPDENGTGRVGELERRVEKLEGLVHAQQRTIDDLVRTLREETDRVRVLRGELDKYAQCVTQV